MNQLVLEKFIPLLGEIKKIEISTDNSKILVVCDN